MIYIDICKRDNIDKIIDSYYQQVLASSRKKQSLIDWCEEHLSDVYGKKYSFEEVIKATPSQLKELVKYFDGFDKEDFFKDLYLNRSVYKWEKNEEGKLEKTTEKNRCYIADTLYGNMKPQVRQYLLNSKEVFVCPYCNRNYTYNDDEVSTAQLDHFYSKSVYPILAISFYNLVPSCPKCNRMKKETKFLFHPYDSQNENIEMVKFSYSIKNSDFLTNKDSIVVEINATDEKYNEQIDELCLKNLYKYHNDIVFDIIRKENIFNDTYISGLLTDFNGLFSSECEIKALIFGVPLTKKEVGSRPLSKLTQDILSEF